MPSIFGIAEPKIVSGATTVLLDHTDIIKNEPIYDVLVHESKISGNRIIYGKGYHWMFELRLNLFRYAVPLTKWNELFPFIHTEVTLHPHRDKDPFKDSDSDVVKFFFMEMIPRYLRQDIREDILILKFISTRYVDISRSILIASLITELDEVEITTEDGEGIILG